LRGSGDHVLDVIGVPGAIKKELRGVLNAFVFVAGWFRVFAIGFCRVGDVEEERDAK
jgi:hypothetical protein